MKKLNFEALAQLADENDQPRLNVYVAAFIQAKIGELEAVLKLLMGMTALVPLMGLYLAATGAIAWLVFVCLVIMSLAVGAVLFIEHLYCSKGASFLTTVTGISRALCPDKNYLHRSDELQKTMSEIKQLLEKQNV